MKRIDVVTIFPQYFEPLKLSLIGRAIDNGLLEVNLVNLRDFAPLPHRNVDDTPYGGGAGMVMKADILGKAIDRCLGVGSDSFLDAQGTPREPASNNNATLIFTSPAGKKFTQNLAHQLKSDAFERMILICGRFEGYDARVVQYYRELLGEQRVLELSIGDYVLNGGEVATLVMIEAITRLVPGVIGNPDSLVEESHELGEDGKTLLEYPNYTRPQDFRGLQVPEVLLGGNHKEIETWRRQQAEMRTAGVGAKQ